MRISLFSKKTKTQTEKIERFVVGKTKFNGFEINYVDYPSYNSTLKELFDHKIYFFNIRNCKNIAHS
jgi:hypothetical protein